MTPDALAALHARAMAIPAPWTAKDFADLLIQPGYFLETVSSSSYHVATPPPPGPTPKPGQSLQGFALGRVVLNEAELLTLAVDPATRRQGIGRACLMSFEGRAAALGAETAFLDVAATNAAALALYRIAGWAETGRRKAYYRGRDGRIDAILMQKRLVPA